MKTKTFSRKLSLNKKTVADLDMSRIRAGEVAIVKPIDDEETYWNTCVTICTLCAPTYPKTCNETVFVAEDRTVALKN